MQIPSIFVALSSSTMGQVPPQMPAIRPTPRYLPAPLLPSFVRGPAIRISPYIPPRIEPRVFGKSPTMPRELMPEENIARRLFDGGGVVYQYDGSGLDWTDHFRDLVFKEALTSAEYYMLQRRAVEASEFLKPQERIYDPWYSAWFYGDVTRATDLLHDNIPLLYRLPGMDMPLDISAPGVASSEIREHDDGRANGVYTASKGGQDEPPPSQSSETTAITSYPPSDTKPDSPAPSISEPDRITDPFDDKTDIGLSHPDDLFSPDAYATELERPLTDEMRREILTTSLVPSTPSTRGPAFPDPAEAEEPVRPRDLDSEDGPLDDIASPSQRRIKTEVVRRRGSNKPSSGAVPETARPVPLPLPTKPSGTKGFVAWVKKYFGFFSK